MLNNPWRCSHLGMARDSNRPTQCNITADVGVGLSGARGGVRLSKKRQLSQSHCMCSSWLHRSYHPPGGGCVIAGCKASILHEFLEEQTFSFLPPLATLQPPILFCGHSLEQGKEEMAPSVQACMLLNFCSFFPAQHTVQHMFGKSLLCQPGQRNSGDPVRVAFLQLSHREQRT